MIRKRIAVEWVAAALAPWAISPHPNFPPKVITPAAELGLVTELRYSRERDRYEVSREEHDAAWQLELVSAAQGSLLSDSQSEAAARLWTLAESPVLPWGARAAAAMFASVAWSDLERSREAGRRLAGMLEDFHASVALQELDVSSRIVVGALTQQRVARLIDGTQLDEAMSDVERVLEILVLRGERPTETFEVSAGISWKAGRVQEDLVTAIRQHAISAKAVLEQTGGNTWSRVVRDRTSWVDVKSRLRAAERDALVVRDEFDAKFEATSTRTVFMQTEAYEPGYAALLHAELAADIGRARANRRELAEILLLRADLDATDVAQSLRLLRQAGATRQLQSVVRWLRAQGPTSALTSDALLVLERYERAGHIVEADLIVLEGASDFLADHALRRGIAAALEYQRLGMTRSRSAWAVLDRAWRCIARLLPESGDDALVAKHIFGILHRPELLSQPLINTITNALGVLDWDALSHHERERFQGWAEAVVQGKNDDIRHLRSMVALKLGSTPSAEAPYGGIELAAHLAEGDVEASPALLADARRSLVSALSAEVAQAAQGMTSVGVLSTALVAVAFASKFSDAQVWSSLATHLADPAVATMLKGPALDRLSARPQVVPADVQAKLRININELLRPESRSLSLGGRALPVEPSALRVAARFKMLEPGRLLKEVLALAGGNASSRLEAARSIPLAIASGDPTWGHALLLQLAQDVDPDVRAEAGNAMVLVLSTDSSLSATLQESISRLLRSDGIRVPLRVLHGFQQALSQESINIAPFADGLIDLARSSSPRILRAATEEVLKLAPPNLLEQA